VGLADVLARSVVELPRSASAAGVDWYLEQRGRSTTLDQLLGTGPEAAEARQLLPAKERKALVERVRGYLLSAAEAGLIAPRAALDPIDPIDEPPAESEEALDAWAGRHGVLGLIRGDVAVLADLGDIPGSLADQLERFRVATLGEAIIF
jgi:hypothetical protein